MVLGFMIYHIPHVANQKVKTDLKDDAVVTVVEGSMTATQVTVELDRLLQGKGPRVVEEKGTNTYATTFFLNEPDRRAANYIKKQMKSRLGKQQKEKNYKATNLLNSTQLARFNWNVNAGMHSKLPRKARPIGLGCQPRSNNSTR
jgi:hypothetical protein